MDRDKVRTKTSAQSDGMSNAGRAVQDLEGVGRSIDGTPLQVLRSPVNTKSFPASWATIRELHDSAKKQNRRPMREQADLGDEYYENDNGNGGDANADQNNNGANTSTNNTRGPEPISIKPGISNQIGSCSAGERFISPVAQNAGVQFRASFWSGAALPADKHDHESLSPVVSKARSARTIDQTDVGRNVAGVTNNGRSKDVHTPSKPTLVNTNSGVTRNDKPSAGVAPTTPSQSGSLSSRRLKRFVARREACIAARSAEAKDTHSTMGGRQERSVERENKCCATSSQGPGVSDKGATASQRSTKSKPQLNIAGRLAMVKDKSEANSTR
jgi:hypothetical protein